MKNISRALRQEFRMQKHVTSFYVKNVDLLPICQDFDQFYQENFERKKIVLRLKISFFRRELVACFRKGAIWIEWTRSKNFTKVSLFVIFGGHFTKLINSA